MEFINTAFDDSTMSEETKRGGRMGRRRHLNDHGTTDQGFKSKNLDAERRRREKLSSRLLKLRAAVPIITNAMIPKLNTMNNATIITDAITYITELQKCVKDLSDQLFEMEATMPEEPETEHFQVDAAKEMKKWGIEKEVTVTCIDGNKLWIKIVLEKKRGGFTKLMEAMSVLGIDFVDINVTTSKGAILVTSSIEGIHGGIIAADQVKEFLLEVIKAI